MELIGPYLIACALLLVAGVGKAVRPADTARALAGWVTVPEPTIRWAVRLGAVVEIVIGVTAVVMPRTWSAALVALSYALFAVVVAAARARGGALASCGCFGTPDTPATLFHLVVDVGLAGAAAVVALARPEGSIVSILAHQPGHGVPLVAVSALGAWLVYLALSSLASVQAARRLTGITFGAPR